MAFIRPGAHTAVIRSYHCRIKHSLVCGSLVILITIQGIVSAERHMVNPNKIYHIIHMVYIVSHIRTATLLFFPNQRSPGGNSHDTAVFLDSKHFLIGFGSYAGCDVINTGMGNRHRLFT